MESLLFLATIGLLYKYTAFDKGILFYIVMFWLIGKVGIELGMLGFIVTFVILKVIKDLIYGVSHP